MRNNWMFFLLLLSFSLLSFPACEKESVTPTPTDDPALEEECFKVTFPLVTVPCEEYVEVYQNQSGKRMTISLQLTDHCEGIDSEVIVENEDGEILGDEKKVVDGETKTFSFTVPSGGFITIDCNGDGSGGCPYTLGVHD